MTSVSYSWHWRASAACVARLGTVAGRWRSWPMANTLACWCSCQWWTFWTYLVTVNLFSLYLMNFTFHTTFDAVGNILRVKSMKCDVSFSQGSVSKLTLFRWGELIICVCVKNVLPAYSSAKIILKNQTSFSRVMITNVGLLPRFYEPQCIGLRRRKHFFMLERQMHVIDSTFFGCI